MFGLDPISMKPASILILGFAIGCAVGWYVGYVHPKSAANRHAVQYMEKVEPDFSGSAIYALSTIPLILSGNTNEAIARLSHPIAAYYRFYALDPGTNDYRLRMRQTIEEMARTNPLVAASIQREIKPDEWRHIWIDGLGTYATVKVDRITNSSSRAEPKD